MYYFSNIEDKELCSLPKPYAPNFGIKLTDILHKTNGTFDNKLFKIDEVVSDSIFRIYPMFNCKTISSTNASDKIFENRLIICKKETTETHVTFISDENAEVQDYSSYGTYYEIEDNLSTTQFNSIVDLIRNNTVNTDSFHLKQGLVNGDWADYTFDIDGTTFIDQGILITDETLTSLGRVMLTNRKLHYTTYTLKLKVYHITDINVCDEVSEDNIEVDTLDIVLVENEWVTIPFTLLDYNYVISFDATVEILFDVPVIPDIPKHIRLNSDKNIIQTGEKADITALVEDIGGAPVGEDHDIYFYEAYEPTTITVNSDKSIMQTGDKADITATLKDEDGSLIADENIYFYVKEE